MHQKLGLRAQVSDEKKLLVFEMQCLRSIPGVSRFNRIRNEEIRRITGSEKTTIKVIKDERLK